jgi:hypothetical protein
MAPLSVWRYRDEPDKPPNDSVPDERRRLTQKIIATTRRNADMAVTIFSTRASSTEEWLYIDDSGTVVHHTKSVGWSMGRKSVRPRDLKMSPDEAKKRWPVYSVKIDEALAGLKK